MKKSLVLFVATMVLLSAVLAGCPPPWRHAASTGPGRCRDRSPPHPPPGHR